MLLISQCRIYLCIVIIFFVNFNSFASEKDWTPLINITRFEYRLNEDDQWSSLASYVKFKNNFFLLGYYQVDMLEAENNRKQSILYFGKPFSSKSLKGEYGWVSRAQHFESFQLETAIGLQASPNIIYKNRFKDNVWAKWLLGTTTFIQVFPVKSKTNLTGVFDINHRFAIPGLPKGWGIRGYNRLHHLKDGTNIIQNNTDLIKSLGNKMDVYTRVTWTNKSSDIYGAADPIMSLGFRFNFVYK
jgi:hypothetical protein